MFWFLVLLVDAGESLDETLPRLLVQAFGVSFFAYLQRRVYEDFEERQTAFLVYVPSHYTIGHKGRYEAAQAYVTCVCEEFRHFCNSPYVFLAVFWGETQVFVEAVAHVIAIKTEEEKISDQLKWKSGVLLPVGWDAMTDEVFFQSEGNCRFSSSRKASEPNRASSETLVRTKTQNFGSFVSADVLGLWPNVCCFLDVLEDYKISRRVKCSRILYCHKMYVTEEFFNC